jgi:hypothetical protein
MDPIEMADKIAEALQPAPETVAFWKWLDDALADCRRDEDEDDGF